MPPRSTRHNRLPARPTAARPRLEVLEERVVPTNFPTVGSFDPGSGVWYLRNENSSGAPDAGQFAYGGVGWQPVVGDWDGNGSATVGVVDPHTGTWYLRNENSSGGADAAVPFAYGLPGWIPLAGDWTGTGHSGIGTFDPATATFYLRNEAGPGAPDAGVFQYGGQGWIPVAGDWSGNGVATVGAVDPASETWYLRNENSSGAPDAGVFQYGGAGWKPVVGDWDSNGTYTPGVVDPNTGTWYLRDSNSAGGASAGSFAYGLGGWSPVAGAWAGTKAPFVRNPVSDATLTQNFSGVLDLAGVFDDVTLTNSLVQYNTSAGAINVRLLDRQAPQTVANFLNYVTSGRYSNSVFHRSAKLADGSPFVLQGGGFTFNTGPSRLVPIATDPAVQNEADPVNRSNLLGTLAMAKQPNDPNSATDQFFFNLGNNSGILDGQNGGFTVFGRVVGAADQQVVNALAAIKTFDESAAAALPPSEQGVFGEIPLQNYTGTNFPTDTTAANYALVKAVTVVRRTDLLTYTVVGNTNPQVLATHITNNRLSVQTGTATGTTTVTVRATNRAGQTADVSFKVTVS